MKWSNQVARVLPWKFHGNSQRGEAIALRGISLPAGVLTLVAFQFVAADSLPRVPYLTLMDALILWSFLITASTLVLNVRNKRRFRTEEALGLKADRVCRWAYPLVYFGGLFVIVMRRYVL